MATTMEKVWEIAKNEVKLCCGFIRRDVSMGMLPIPIFTAASLLYRNAPAEEFLLAIAKTLFLGLLYLYPFVVGNQICGVQEDQINKPDRPIAAGKTSLKAARIRWITLTIMFFVYACYLRVGIWSAMWIIISIAHNFLSLGDFGPTKDMCVGLGSIAQLTAAWLVGGAPYEIGWSWIKIMALYTFFPISLQDLRDVPGDLAVGRRTTPILIGDIPCRIYISLGVLVSQFLLIRYRILEYRLDWTTVLFSSILASLALTVIFRLFAFRDVKSDRYSYRLYTIIYLFQPLSACIALR